MKRTKKMNRWLLTLIWVVVAALLLEGGMMTAVFVAEKQERILGKSDCIIVLGARVMPDHALSTTLDHRIDTALDIYQKDYAGAFILCGAKGKDEPVSEARAMADYLRMYEVPESAILLDEQSYNTEQNMDNARAIMEKNGFETAIVVTSDYHLTRSLWIARDAGIQAIGAPAPGPDLWYNRVKARARETLSWLNYWGRKGIDALRGNQ